MADEVSTHITIGGRVAEEDVPALCQAIVAEYLGLEWCGDAFLPGSGEDLLAACKPIGKSRVLRLFDDCAVWGEFRQLEAFLVEHQIPFDRQHEAKYEIASTKLIYRPEIGSSEFITNMQEEIVTPVSPLWPLIKMLTQVQTDLRLGRNRVAGFIVDECLEKLHDNLPPELPALPSLEIVAAKPS